MATLSENATERFVVEYQQVHDRVAPLASDRRGMPRWLAMYGPCSSVEAAESLIEREGQHPRRGTYRRYRIVRQVPMSPGSKWFMSDGVICEGAWPDDLPTDWVS